jgi:hypothetical protein
MALAPRDGMLTSAAAIGALLGGGRDIALLGAHPVGAIVLLVLVILWSYARTFCERDT